MIAEGLLFETVVLITISLLLLWTLYKVNIENLPLTMEETYIFYKDKIISLENVVLLRLKEFYSVEMVHKISLFTFLAKLKRLCEKKRDYVLIGRIYERIYRMVSEEK